MPGNPRTRFAVEALALAEVTTWHRSRVPYFEATGRRQSPATPSRIRFAPARLAQEKGVSPGNRLHRSSRPSCMCPSRTEDPLRGPNSPYCGRDFRRPNFQIVDLRQEGAGFAAPAQSSTLIPNALH